MADIDSMLVQYGQDDLAALDRRLDTARIQAVILMATAWLSQILAATGTGGLGHQGRQLEVVGMTAYAGSLGLGAISVVLGAGVLRPVSWPRVTSYPSVVDWWQEHRENPAAPAIDARDLAKSLAVVAERRRAILGHMTWVLAVQGPTCAPRSVA